MVMEGVGTVNKVWMGHVSDQSVRLNAASGGIITGSLISLLDAGFIDGAVVNIPDINQPPKGKSILAKTKKELLHSAKSIYCMTEIKQGLDIAKYDVDVQRIAVVGLPCQVSDLKKVMKRDSLLANKVIFCMGIMCGHNMLPSATIEALKQSGIDINKVKEIRYRSYGWYPFFYSVSFKNGDVKDFVWSNSPLQKIWESLKYQPQRCLRCVDFAAESADIACCDAWLEEYRGNQEGYSIVLTHNRKGTSIIEQLIKDKILSLKETDVSCIQRSQRIQLEHKLNRKRGFEKREQ
jgi:coenzyme F420-reducing hydrogenase beta subunit